MKYTAVAILVSFIVILIVFTFYIHYYNLNLKCQTSPNYWCYSDWQCEADSTIGDYDCTSKGNCLNVISSFYNGSLFQCSATCSDQKCQCKWNPTVSTSETVPNNAPPCSAYNNVSGSIITIGTYVCGDESSLCKN